MSGAAVSAAPTALYVYGVVPAGTELELSGAGVDSSDVRVLDRRRAGCDRRRCPAGEVRRRAAAPEPRGPRLARADGAGARGRPRARARHDDGDPVSHRHALRGRAAPPGVPRDEPSRPARAPRAARGQGRARREGVLRPRRRRAMRARPSRAAITSAAGRPSRRRGGTPTRSHSTAPGRATSIWRRPRSRRARTGPRLPSSRAGQSRCSSTAPISSSAATRGSSRRSASWRKHFGPQGVTYELTGPWPPYNFVPRDLGGR